MTWKRLILFFGFALVMAALSCQPAWSQSAESGSISGTVTDSTGAVIPGATVTARSVSTGAERTVTAGSNGQYVIQGLIPGVYQVTVTSGNFQPFKSQGEVTVGGKLTLDAQLSLSGTTTTVEVVGAGGTSVNTQTQELSQLVDTTQMTQLPSLNRDPYDFVSLSGNVSNGDQTSNGGAPNAAMTVGQSLTGYGVGYSLNGQRETGTEILLDGVENVGVFSDTAGQPVPANSIQEFSIITNNYGPEYGRASGGVVNVDSKQGTNDIHGDAFEFNRLSAYTANTYGDVANDVPKGIYTRNDFGFDAGAPIIKNKLFVFSSNEFVRVRSDTTQTEEILDPSFIALLPSNVQNYFSKFGTGAHAPSGTVTTAAQLAANATVSSGFPGATSTTGGPFPMINGVTPVSPTQPVFDVVNFPAPFNAGGGVPQNTYDLLGRIDYNLTDKTQMFFRYARYSEDDFGGSVFYSPYSQYNVGGTSIDNSALFSIDHIFSDNLLSTTKFSFARFDFVQSYDTALTATPNLYLSTSSYTEQVDNVTNNVIQMPGLANTADGSGGLPFGGPQNTFQISHDVAWTKGRHTMHFGGEFTYLQLNIAYGAYYQANEVLGSALGPSIDTLVNAGGATQGGEYASPVLQFAARVNAEGALPCATDAYGNEIITPSCLVTPPLPAANPARSYRYKDWALYAGDSFKVTRKLTLNYALRYEHYGVQHNNHADLDSNWYDGAGPYPEDIATGGIFLTSQSPIGEFWKPRWGTAAPRVGFAYDVFGDGKTALRGGFGISYERNFGNVTYNASFNPPASAVVSSDCSAASDGVITNCGQFITNNDLGPLGLPGSPSPLTPSEVRDDQSNINVAQTQFWSLDLQRQLATNTMVDVSYSGAHGVHLYDLNNVNLIGAAQEYLGAPLLTGTDPVSGTTCPYTNPYTNVPTCYTRPNSQYAAINQRGSDGISSYNALNVALKMQNLHHTGLSLTANYTYSHSLDDLSTTFSDDLTQGSLGYTNFTDPKLDYGNSDFDIRHRIVISPIWQVPYFKDERGWQGEVLGGWTVSSIFTARSGLPFSIYDESFNLNGYTIPRYSPSSTITQYTTGTPVPVLNPLTNLPEPNTFTGLTLPAPNDATPLNPTLGISDFGPYPANMTGRGAFHGPAAWNDDLSISKKFKLTERFDLEFRAEAFNVFNHHDYYVYGGDNYIANPTTNAITVTEFKGGLGSAALGGNNDERRFGQFALKLDF